MSNESYSEGLYIGLLSGTSMDAIDCAIVSFENDKSHKNNKPILIETLNYPFPNEFKKSCLELTQNKKIHVDELAMLDIEAGELFANAALEILKKTNLNAKDIKAIGSHGQTIRHRPDVKYPFSLQIGDPNIIAERTNITTIADFRRRDMAAGGQGAPLAPGFHNSVFRNASENRVIVNIGGISNLTILPKELNQPIIGFDSGPGNCLMDFWVKHHWDLDYDADGNIAKSGKLSELLLEQCLKDNYFSMPHPKSTGREYFNEQWLFQKIQTSKNILNIPEDIQTTLLLLTVRSISDAILKLAPNTHSVYVCGGGVHNKELMHHLQNELKQNKLKQNEMKKIIVSSTETLGLPPDWIEAMLFAWLAKQTLEGKEGNCPSVTGARSYRSLGGIYK